MARSPDTAATASDLPAPKHATLWASLVYLISTMLLAYPALAGNFLINVHSDQYLAGYAFREFGARSLRSGHGFPLWNPYLQGGLPYVAAMHGDIFYPTFLLRLVMPTDMAMTWEFPIHLFLCGLLTYLFLRAWRFGHYAALVGGLAYMLTGSIAGYASPGHDGKLFVSTMLPGALLLITRGVRDGRLWAWGGLSLVTALAALSPHPQLFEYMLLVAGAFALYVAFAEHPAYGRLPRNVAIQRLCLALGAVGLGIAISAIQYMPLFEYRPWSPRAGGHDYATATSFSFPIEETLNAYWPQFSGILDGYWGRNGVHLHSDYFGVVALVLFAAAFGQFRQRGFRLFWIVTGAVALLWAYGGFTPFFRIPLAIVPYTKYFRAPSTIIFVTAFSVAVLAAIGIERVIARRISVRFMAAWAIAATAFAILMSVGGYSAIANAVAGSIASAYPANVHAQVVDQFSQGAAGNSTHAILGVWRSLLFVLLTVGVLWGLSTQRIAARAAVIALAALLVVDLWSVERLYWMFSPRASTLYATDPGIDAIKADIAKHGPGRVWTTAAFGGYAAPRDAGLYYDGLMVHDLPIAIGYHGNELDRYDQLTAAANVSGRGDVLVLSPAFWRQENIRYIYTDSPDSTMQGLGSALKLPSPFVQIAGPVRDAAGSMVYVYRIPQDDPFGWVASAIVKAPDQQSLNTVLDPRFVPASLAIADLSDTTVTGAEIAAMPAPSATTVAVKSYAPGAIDLDLSQPAKAGEALVVSENYFPGWSALVDGRATRATRMDFNLIGLALPTGARSVQLRFDDAAYEIGKRVTIVTLILALIVWLGGLALDRRRRAPAPSPTANA
ncbi:MAG: hypothetical protein ACHQWU_10395 [Gemmatimonadales bacterium]